MTRRPWSHAAVVLSVAVGVSASAGTAAWATAQARATGTQPVAAVATFGAQASTSASSSSQAGPLVLTFGTLTQETVFFVRSTGSLALSGQTWNVTISNSNSVVKGSVDVLACVGGTYNAQAVCSGNETPVVQGLVEGGGTASKTTTYSLPAGSALSAKVRPARKITGFTVTIGMTVTRAQTTPGSRTSSA